MQSLSADQAGGRPRPSDLRAPSHQRLLPYLGGLLATLLAAAGGALAAVSVPIALLVAAGLAGAAILAYASSALSIAALLVIRSVTDATAETPIVAGLNAGALVGIVLIMSAGGLIAARLVEKQLPVRGMAVTIIVSVGIVYWFGLGVLRYGPDQSLIRELVRTASILAVALIAANSDRSITASRLGTILVLAALIPAILISWEAVTNWQAMVGENLRPRGTMSHPNAAAILFGIAAPVAVWKALHDRAGVLYLWVAAFFILAVLFTRSMGGLAQITVAMLAMGALQKRGPVYRLGVITVVAAMIGFFVFDPLGISRISELESTEIAIIEAGGRNTGITSEGQDNSFEWRLTNWRLLLERWQDAKLLGFGLGTTEDIVTPLGHLPHSDPVRFLVETGVVGLTLLGVAYLAVVRRLIGLARRGPNASFAGATLAVIAGVSTHALVTHVSFNTAPAYVLAVLLGWILIRRTGEGAEDATASGHPNQDEDRHVYRTEREAASTTRHPRIRVAIASDVPRATGSTSGQPIRRSLSRPPWRGEE